MDSVEFFLSLGGGGGHGGVLVTHLPPTSEVHGSKPEPYVGKMVAFD